LKFLKQKNRQHSSKWSIPHLKRRIHVGAKDKNPRKCKLQQINDGTPKDSSFIKQTINIVSKSSPNIDSIETLPEKAFLEEIHKLCSNMRDFGSK
jgi:hypothetical protein